MAEFSKLAKIELGYTDWDTWRTEVIHRLRIDSCAQCIGMADGVAQGFEDVSYMLYMRHVALVAILSNIEGITVDSAFAATQDEFRVELAAWKKGRKLRNYKRTMDGVCVSVPQLLPLLDTPLRVWWEAVKFLSKLHN